MSRMTSKRTVRAWLSDMDGVLVHEEEPIPGAADFVARLTGTGRPFLLLTNNSIFTPRDLKARLHRSGIDVPEDAIWTSALATAQFLDDQRPGGTAYFVARGMPDDQARDLTVALVGALEGAFVLARTLRDTEPLLAAGRVLAPRYRGIALSAPAPSTMGA